MSGATPIDWLENWAASHGNSPAVTSNGRTFDFLTLQAMVAGASSHLRNAVSSDTGGILIVAVVDPVQQWVLILAAMNVGLTPCPMAQPHADIAGLGDAVVLCDPERLPAFTAAFGKDRCLLAPDLAAASGASRCEPADRGETGIVLLSSGTTGTPKAVPLTYATIQQRTLLRDRYFPVKGGIVSLMQPGFAGGFQSCLTALKNGVVIDISDRIDCMIAATEAPGSLQLVGSPAQLMALMAEMRFRNRVGSGVSGILTMGGYVAPGLVAEAQDLFACPMLSLYGTTELGACAILDPAQADQGMDMLPGVLVGLSPLDGALRMKTPGMAKAYLDGTTEGTTRFEDGWFVPGDLGRVSGNRLWIEGRGSEVVNVGGQKLDPARIDAALSDLSVAQDLAAFGFTTPQGDPMLMIAIVEPDDSTYAAAKRRIRTLCLVPQPSLGFFRVDRIPRAGLGKPARQALADMVRDAMRKS